MHCLRHVQQRRVGRELARTVYRAASSSNTLAAPIDAAAPRVLPVLPTAAAASSAVGAASSNLSLRSERSDEVHKTRLRRLEVIHDPALNRGTGFSTDERERLCLRGLVPPRQQGLDHQIERVMATYRRQATDLDKYQFLSLLMDRNTVLFYRILVDNFSELAPIVYTPTVGDACEKFHDIYRRARGMYFSVEDRDQFRTMVYNWPSDDVDVIVVTDGSRVLALGDLGCNSMNIPIGKLSLYVSGAGLNPLRVLPVVLDVGTDNDELRENPLYLGLPRKRLKGDEYFQLIDEWMSAVRQRWPHVLVQFEDFSSDVAGLLLERYRERSAPAFNDDIQSTGCIAVATVLASLRARGRGMDGLSSETIVCAGAGSAGLGVCEALVRAMTADGGMSEREARARFYLVDASGLLSGANGKQRAVGRIRHFVRSDAEAEALPDGMPLADVVRKTKPSILLGLSGVGGLFSRNVVTTMADAHEQPVIMPMSNPSRSSECTAEDAFAWTGGRAIFASGSPFANVVFADGELRYANQANNVYSFPGLGLAVTALRISCVTETMFLAAAKRIAMLMPDDAVRRGLLFPPVSELRSVSAEVAAAVGVVAVQEGLVTADVPDEVKSDADAMLQFMRENMWEPKYGHIVAEDT